MGDYDNLTVINDLIYALVDRASLHLLNKINIILTLKAELS